MSAAEGAKFEKGKISGGPIVFDKVKLPPLNEDAKL